MGLSEEEQAESALAVIERADSVEEIPAEVESKKWKTPGFQKMRLDWRSDDRDSLVRMKGAVDRAIMKQFGEVYQILNTFYNVVRTPVADANGEIQTDPWGFPIWERNEFGSFVEDYTKLTRKEHENFLYTFTTRLFQWQQDAIDLWGEAMFAKAQWEEAFSIGFQRPGSGTVDDRTAAGRIDAREERYFALYLSLISRKADALVRSIELIAQRLKDTLPL